LREKFSLPVAFGNHSKNLNVIFASLAFEPSDIFFYVKGDKEGTYPDDAHSVPLNNCKIFINDLHEVNAALGKGIKMKMENLISKSKG